MLVPSIVMHDHVLFDGSSSYGHYQVADVAYAGRPARMLYSGDGDAAQSGMALDGNDELLFDYNQRFIELLRGLVPKRVLIIGGGAFTLPTALQREMPDSSLDVVERDPVLLAVAVTYFDFKPASRTRIYMGDGIDFLEQAAGRYDAIIVDVFIDAMVPLVFQTEATARQYRQLLLPHGLVAMNVIGDYYGSRGNSALGRQAAVFQAAFQDVQIFPAGPHLSLWMPQNFVVIAQPLPREITWMRSRPIQTLYSAQT